MAYRVRDGGKMRKLILLGIIIVIPTLTLLANLYIENHFQNKWNENLDAEAAEIVKSDENIDLANLVVNKQMLSSLSYVCGNLGKFPDLGVGETCLYYSGIQYMKYTSIGLIGVGVISYLLISFLGIFGKISRKVLLRLFSLGLYLSLLIGALIISVNGLLVIGTLFVGGVIVFDILAYGWMIAIGFGILAGIAALISPIKNIVRPVKSFVIGKPLPKNLYPAIWSFAKKGAENLGTREPDQIIVGLGEEIFVTESEVDTVNGSFEGRTLFISMPFMRKLEKDELLSVVGHELGHFRGEDTYYSTKFYPIYRGTQEALGNLLGSDDSEVSILSMPVSCLLFHFLEVFAKLENKFGRERELVADKAGAELTSKETMAKALTKVHAYSGAWSGVEKTIVNLLTDGNTLTNASKYYEQNINEIDKDIFESNIEDTHIEHPTDSHPKFSLRMTELGYKKDEFYNVILSELKEPSIDLIPNYEKIEEELTGLETTKLIQLGYGPPEGDQPVEAST